MSRTDLVQLLYIVAFALFIYGLMGLTGPRTAVRGNRIAAVGMAIAVIATLLIPGMGNWGLIALGVAIGTAIGIPAARQVKMTAMPQMVALFNGVGGDARDDQRAEQHDPVDRVRARHQRRVQRVWHLGDDHEADEAGEHEDGEVGDEHR